jgi:hypothetical protein
MNTLKKRNITIIIEGVCMTLEEICQHKQELEKVFTTEYGKNFKGISVDDRGAKSENPILFLCVKDYIDIAHLGRVSYSQMKQWEKDLRKIFDLADDVEIDVVYDYEQYDEYEGQSILEWWHVENGGWLAHSPGMNMR